EGGPSRASSGPHPCSSFGCLFLIGGRNAILRREVARTGTSGGGRTRLHGRGGSMPAGTGQGRIQCGGGAGPRAAVMKWNEGFEGRPPLTEAMGSTPGV